MIILAVLFRLESSVALTSKRESLSILNDIFIFTSPFGLAGKLHISKKPKKRFSDKSSLSPSYILFNIVV